MEDKTWGCSSSEDSDDEVYLQNASDEEELDFSSGSIPKLQFRNVKSKSCWNEEMGMGEVIEKNGKMWITTGIVRSGKIYSSIEETLYLMELGALHQLENSGRSISLTEMYEKVVAGTSGCCWELFEVYRHLKSLGYIIGRHGVLWSLKSIRCSHRPAALEITEESKELVDMGAVQRLFSELRINELRPDFDVYLPTQPTSSSVPPLTHTTPLQHYFCFSDMKHLIRRLSRVADSSNYTLLRSDSSSDDANSSRGCRRRLRAESFRASKIRRSSAVVPEGHVPIYVGDEMERFVVCAELLNHPVFVKLLNESAQEYGYEQKGVLRLPCRVFDFERVLHALRLGLDAPDVSELVSFSPEEFS